MVSVLRTEIMRQTIPVLTLNITGVRIKIVHFLPGDERPSTQVPSDDFPSQRSASSHLYVGAIPYDLIFLFRLGEADGRKPDMIDKNTHEIKQDDDKVVYKSLEELGDDLPDHSPRYILLSYPLTMVRERWGFGVSNR
jgi:hypothetical protein